MGCVICGTPLVRKEYEKPYQFAVRQTCDRGCAGIMWRRRAAVNRVFRPVPVFLSPRELGDAAEVWLRWAREQLTARFWPKVNRSGPVTRPGLGPCWVWLAGTDKDGYGKFAIHAPAGFRPKQKHVRAHRLLLEIELGPLPPMLVSLHACDNPPCVKTVADEFGPAHLRPGTQAENLRDSISKGRSDPRAPSLHG
jgi:hypothetical protein